MDRKWLPLNALRAFEAAGQHLSFTAAANQLTVAQSAVSRHVIMLERFLGLALFERRPQQLALTAAGAHLLAAVTKSFDRIDQAMAEVVAEAGRPQRVLRVVLPATFASQLAVPILKDFRAEHAHVTLEVTSRPMTGALDGDADLAVLYTETQTADAIHDLLWMVRLDLACSPALAERGRGLPLPDFLAATDLLHVKLGDKPRHYLWDLFRRSIGRPDLPVDRGLVFDTSQLAAQYAMSGEGVALLDPVLFRAEIAADRLVRPFEAGVADGYGYFLRVHPQDLDNEPVALLRDWLLRRFRRPLAPDGETAREAVGAA